MNIVEDDLQSQAIADLLQEHLDHMYEISPPEDVHALDLEALRLPEVTFWCAWTETRELMGCGALKQLCAKHGEIKSMRTAKAFIRKGVAAAILEHMIQTAKQRGYKRLSLETGPVDTFGPAHTLYRKFGFQYCGPFADYELSAFCDFMTLEL